MRNTKLISLLGVLALAIAAALVAVAAATPPSGPVLTGVPSANTRSAGYAPASALSPELSQTVVAQGSTKLENPSALTSYYGYDNDVTNSAERKVTLSKPACASSPL
ncbi:MAG TPA: hypothetical protein VFX44_03160 [Solirubrobacterales bacterium]|nr:hypothetical protein [Solirubrobacterales bacterium]